jgi:hypothetical protein
MTTTTKRPTIPCEHCGSHRTTLKRTHTYSNGAYCQQMHCKNCGKRFRVFPNGDAPPPDPRRVEFDDATFLRILRTTTSFYQLAKELGCSRQLLDGIRNGTYHRDRMPDVKRGGLNPPPVVIPDGPSCWRCSEWRETYCAIGFPDPQVEGPRFAADCSLYPERCIG